MKPAGIKPALWIPIFLALLGPASTGCRAEAGPPGGTDPARQMEERFTQVSSKVGPAVVSISTEVVERMRIGRQPFGGGSPFSGFNGDELFERFFDDFFGGVPQEEKEFRQRGLGTGVLIDPKGYVLTNEHVVHGAGKLTVTLPDGRKFDGKVKGTDVRSDLAVVQIDAKNLPSAELGDSDQVKSGQWAIAIGNPFGFAVGGTEPTLTVGVISALHRSIRIDRAVRDYSNLIQTDAAINPGNSGGPLANLDGQVIGINTAIFSTTGGYQGIGFAIPINTAKGILSDLIEGKKVLYGWLGVNAQDVTQELAEAFKLPSSEGVIVARVLPDSPAEKAGIQDGDVILSINDQPIKNSREVVAKVSRSKVGEKAALVILREGKEIRLTVEIGERPGETEEGEIAGEGSWRGAKVGPLTPEMAQRFELPEEEGVVVLEVEPGSLAAGAGLRPGDLILEINRKPVRSVRDFSQAAAQVRGDALVKTMRGFLVIRADAG